MLISMYTFVFIGIMLASNCCIMCSKHSMGHSGVAPTSPHDFVHSLLCARGEDSPMYHKMACVQGMCEECGSLCPFRTHELDLSHEEIVKMEALSVL